MQEQLREIYGQIKMPEECTRRIEKAMQEKEAEDARKVFTGNRYMPKPARAAAIVLVTAVLLLLAEGTVYAWTGKGIVSRIVSFAGNAVFTEETDEKGNNISVGTLDTSNMAAPAEFKEGRLLFTANGENIDITEQVSGESAYIYDYRDGQGIIHYLIVGGEPESFGYAEFLYDETKNPGWAGGYFRGGKVGESINPDWLENAKKQLAIPW